MIMPHPKSHFSVEKVNIEVTWIMYETLIVRKYDLTVPTLSTQTYIYIHTHTHAHYTLSALSAYL